MVPLIRHGLRPCHLLPCGAKAIAVPSGALKCRWRSPHPSRLTPRHLPPGEGFVRANLAFPIPGGRWPAGPDEGEYRWVQWPSNGRMGTSAPTQGYDRFRRGRCPQRPVDNGCTPVVPLIRHGCAMPPSPLRGEGFGRSVGNAQMSMAFPSSVTAYDVSPSPRGRLFPKTRPRPVFRTRNAGRGFMIYGKRIAASGRCPSSQ